ncbi:unnamed protein product [Caenorhabditis brenneri]
MHRNAFRCPAVLVTAAVVGGATLLAVAYYFWSRPKKACKPSECCSANQSVSLATPEVFGGDGRPSAGMDTQGEMFSFDDEHVRKVCERLFLEQMDLGEAKMEDEATVEMGAIHIANAIALTGEPENILKVLRGSVPASQFACIQKYLPTADMRVSQLLQDELSIETIQHYFG